MDAEGEAVAEACTGTLPEGAAELLGVAVVETDGDIDMLCATEADGVAVAGSSGAVHDMSVTAPAEPAMQSVPPPPA